MVCPNCGCNIDDGLKFCTECGHKIEGTAASSLQSVPAASASPAPVPPPTPAEPKKETKKTKEKVKKPKKPNNKPKFYRFMLWFSIFGMALFGAIDGIWHIASGLPKAAADVPEYASYGTLCKIFGICLVICAVLSAVTWLILILRSWIAPYTTSGTCLLIALVNICIYFVSKWKASGVFNDNGFYYTERLILAVVFAGLAVFNFFYLKKKKNLIGERMRF